MHLFIKLINFPIGRIDRVKLYIYTSERSERVSDIIYATIYAIVL